MEIANLAGNGHCTVKPDKFQFSIFNFQFSIPSLFARTSLFALCSFLFALCPSAHAQVIADKAVASVTNGSRPTPYLIPYSHLIWQLALEPATPLSGKRGSAGLNRAIP